jgi:hypothetical protein
MSTRYEDLMSAAGLSPAELALRSDEGLVALIASCRHGRAEHVYPSPDVQYPVADRARGGPPVTTTHITQSRAVWALLPSA